MITLVLVYALVTVLVMQVIETGMAAWQKRQPERGSVLVIGLLSMSYFMAMLFSAGAL